MPSLGSVVSIRRCFLKAIVREANNLVTSPRRRLRFASCSASEQPRNKAYICGSCGHAPHSEASQSKREARHLRSILPGNMPAEREDKQAEEEEEELRGEWTADSGVMEIYRHLPGLAYYISTKSFQKPFFPLFFFLPCMWLQTIGSRKVQHVSVLQRCGEHDVTCFVRPLHQNFFFFFWFCYKAANTGRTQSAWTRTDGRTQPQLVEFNPPWRADRITTLEKTNSSFLLVLLLTQ